MRGQEKGNMDDGLKQLSRVPARAESNYREDSLVVMARESKHTLNKLTEH